MDVHSDLAFPAVSQAGGQTAPRRPLLLAVGAAFALTACAQQAATAVDPAAPGFLEGLWHGFIFPVAWVISLFSSNTAIYAVPNDGGWYDFGYFLGICVFGVGARKTQTVYRDRTIEVKAKRIVEPGE
ncbi:hypothetical protein [Sphingomonas alba]|uniref:hypothetical protein n=1 Tax=Sphingomonas alba TaxID=2908208 RepID=UPI0032AF3F0C